MTVVVGVGLGAAQLETARSSYPPAQADPARVAPAQVDPTWVEMDESDTNAGDPTREGVPEDATAPPARLWLVDGFNVLHAGVLVGRDRASWWNEARREQLLAIVERFEAKREDAEIWVVFDGPGGAEAAAREGSRVRVAFARSADEWLVKRVRAAGGSVCVVTGDRQLADRARRRGAEVLSPRCFLARCGHVPA